MFRPTKPHGKSVEPPSAARPIVPTGQASLPLGARPSSALGRASRVDGYPARMAQQPTSPAGADWAKQTTDTIERIVGSVRDKTSGPLLRVARVVVYGTLAAILGIAALVLIAITTIRVLNLLPGGVWVAYLITGTLFTVGGLLMWRLRYTAPATDH
jgi:hypothetical protein